MEWGAFPESLNIVDKINSLDEESQEMLLIIAKNTEDLQRANKA